VRLFRKKTAFGRAGRSARPRGRCQVSGHASHYDVVHDDLDQLVGVSWDVSREEPGAFDRRRFVTTQIELRSDLNAEDDDAQNWTLLENATDPTRVRVGAILVAGTPRFWSVVRITAVGVDGQVHFVQLDESDPEARKLLAIVA
jgi:hypothetical protein